ncbi:FecR family protein [Gynurincola endophyticus]|uniref:FecR family protein n=1 Tax=Gynurincola endophyticus TaxID=2479004 RepID=UPI000F8F4BB2|nr:FecR domain-containing protein [Gynurincola endophyticus]
MEKDIRGLLKVFLQGECSDAELAEIRKVLNTPQAKIILSELIAENEAAVEAGSKLTHKLLQEKSRKVKYQLLKKIKEEEVSALPKTRLISKRLLQHAAVWTGILFVSTFILWKSVLLSHSPNEIASIIKENPEGIPVKHILPDSTIVFLSAGSKLIYPKEFPNAGRDVQLYGEAFFDVTPDKEHPFTIHSGAIKTQVLGTSFKINAFDGYPFEVAVSTGKVAVTTDLHNQAEHLASLTPGMKVTYDNHTQKTTIGSIDINHLKQWIDGDIVFDEKPLAQVLLELNRRFGVQIDCNDTKITSKSVTGSLPAGYPIEKTLELLSDLADFKIRKESTDTFKLYQK